MLTILRTVQVKIILTEAARSAMMEKYERELRQQEDEREQWEFQAKKLLADARKRSADLFQQMQERLSVEERKRLEKQGNLQFQKRQLENLPLGAEIDYMTVQSPVQIQVGDVWEEKMAGTVIVIKDGVIHEIRGGS
ncbi:YlqD family protein [Brevibacillus ruminantium]|uniref:YlqD family protein n=1 Tax=Brevibacillus ruminantium TaxID=2950604 RepID=A0ABY4WKR5_9BACL|nr:YlqD family protein [Brevibacillus ruminantium]USG67745.1 YlqD family protein [Brevibacillus ruminantium]